MAKAKLVQILPSTRYMTTLKVSEKIARELIEMASNATMPPEDRGLPAERTHESLEAIFAPDKAKLAAEFYVTDKFHEMPLPVFRKLVNQNAKGSLAALVADLVSRLDNDSVPPFAQMRSLFCKAAPTTDGFDRASDDEDDDEAPRTRETDDAYDASEKPEDEWSAKYSSDAVKAVLGRWLDLMDQLYGQSGGGKAPGRSPVEAEIKFVAWLAAYWQNELKLPLSSGRGAQSGSDDHDQQGAFANFVRKAAEIIPQKHRPHSWDLAIRVNTGKKP